MFSVTSVSNEIEVLVMFVRLVSSNGLHVNVFVTSVSNEIEVLVMFVRLVSSK